MRKAGKHIVSFILALSMLFSGMCFENVKADSSLEYPSMQVQGTDAILHSAGISCEEACTTEMLCIRGISGIRQYVSRNTHARKDAKAVLEYLWEDSHLHFYSDFLTAAGSVLSFKSCPGAVVLNYIHNKDGKKRI
ncbi:MAG: hypothetical protein K2H52_08845 [Lachnospiraceae bacterium]|nr:hypothetical protein [Lachnospiraceae bacterium]MDE6185946.1 hypothetical protein [Lachnospiraceae bacterium]